MNWIIGNYLFGALGALFRYVFYLLKNTFLPEKEKKRISFLNIWLGYKTDKTLDDLSNNVVNVVLGVFIFVILALIIIKNRW